MSRASRPVLLVALALGVAVGPAAGWATRGTTVRTRPMQRHRCCFCPKAQSRPRSVVPQSPIPTWMARSPTSRLRATMRPGLRSWTKIVTGPSTGWSSYRRCRSLVVRGRLCSRDPRFRIGRRGRQRRAHPGRIPARRSAAARRVPGWRRRCSPAGPLWSRGRRSRRPAEPARSSWMPVAGTSSAAMPTGTVT